MTDNGLPLTIQQWETLLGLLNSLTPSQRQWVSGFVAGFTVSGQGSLPQPASLGLMPPPDGSQSPLTILYGSQTGNAEKLADKLGERLTSAGRSVRLESMAQYKPTQLKRERELLILVSTHGEGEPPDNAVGLHRFLHSQKAPRLEQLRYAVLSLGDSSYEHFCKTGVDFDQRLIELGATPIEERLDCDVDYESAANDWIEKISTELTNIQTPTSAVAQDGLRAGQASFSRNHPFRSTLLENLAITAPDSSKEVRHIVLSIENSGIRYSPGDALGIIPNNWPRRVENLLEVLNLYHADSVTVPSGTTTSLESALLHDFEITTVTRPFLESWSTLAEASNLSTLLKPDQRKALKEWLYGREILDILREYPVRGITGQQFVGLLRKLPPRLYSIASSWAADPEEVHLTVGVVRYQAHGLTRHGVASTYLADRIEEDGEVPVYLHENPNFRLPEDPATPIIMIGPGTGVAPFRAFLSEREATGALGRNWLFFGDRQFENDFLYQSEWLEYRRKGLLNRMDVAFSRDTHEKIYVQHRLRERAKEIHAWLEEGAHVYVCGDAKHMAPDVHSALLDILVTEGGKSPEGAEEILQTLQATKRYQRDIY